MKVENIINDKNNRAANQFVITTEREVFTFSLMIQ